MQTLTTETLTRPLVSPILATTSSGAPLLALADPYAGNPLPSRMVRPDMVAINHAGADEMMHKLKIDARRARFIMEFRQAYGPFARLEDLAQVNGITDTMLRSWEERDVIVLD
jgi:competence ComEA-like helix-hairpin-helix protein